MLRYFCRSVSVHLRLIFCFHSVCSSSESSLIGPCRGSPVVSWEKVACDEVTIASTGMRLCAAVAVAKIFVLVSYINGSLLLLQTAIRSGRVVLYLAVKTVRAGMVDPSTIMSLCG